MSNYVGQKLGNYHLLRLLGSGGFGQVYLGEHIYLKTQAAIKTLQEQRDNSSLESFLTEAQIIAQLEHPHIVRVLEFGLEGNIPFLVMNYAPHGTLRDHHPRGTQVPLAKVVSYISEISDALQHAHNQKLIHRDIKPENMLLGRNNEVLLSDFGIAITAHGTASLILQPAIGTLLYMAPEQGQGKPRPASDQYSLAIVAYEWLSGNCPFLGTSAEIITQHLSASPPPLRQQLPHIPSTIENVILKALAKDPQQRFASVQEFAKELEQASQPVQSITVASSIFPSTQPAIKPNLNQQEKSKQDCFLCALDPHHCAEKRLEGRIRAVAEQRVDGEWTPFITLNTGDALISLQLTRYYLSLVRELKHLDEQVEGKRLRDYNLTLRVYHLPSMIRTSEFNNLPVYHYKANSYTIAVLEPDIILNITDLSRSEYCSRQYLLERLISSQPSAAAISGNLVHHSFKELLKEHDRGALMTGYVANREKTPLATLHSSFEEELGRNSIDLALANIPAETIRSHVAPHLESLANWFLQQRSTLWDMPDSYGETPDGEVSEQQGENTVRAETFLLAPEIGLQGRLDLLWRQAGRQRLLELKTGVFTGDTPKKDHRWQVLGYHALLMVRRDPKMDKALATLLYSGTPGEAKHFGIPFSIVQLQKVNEARNRLVIGHETGIAPAPPGPSRCTKCFMLTQCRDVSSLLDWQQPQPDPSVEDTGSSNDRVVFRQEEITSTDRDFFKKFYQLMHIEGLEGKKQQALLWKETLEERVARGAAIQNLNLSGKPEATGQGEWWQTFQCENTSELRFGDEILLSNGDPVNGEVTTGTIVKINPQEVKVWTPEKITNPNRIDRRDTDLVHGRTLKNLLRWLQADSRLRELVSGQRRPAFQSLPVTQRTDFNNEQNLALFNDEQNLAVERAMQMQDYLLVHGPPGTGKTAVIAEIVKRFQQQGQRVLLAAFTNQAVDNMLKRLDKEGVSNYIRLGHERSVAPEIRGHLLKKPNEQLAVTDNGAKLPEGGEGEQSDLNTQPPVRTLLRQMGVVASTTATWSSDVYDFLSPVSSDAGQDDPPSQFDVAIIDEAGQLTIPAILGALRFAKRFILVGDEKQLPPLVLSEEAAKQGLSESLFSYLKKLDDDYTKGHGNADSACVPLRVQYRMHEGICEFASRMFYDGKLVAHPLVAQRVLNGAKMGARAVREAPSITRALLPSLPTVFLHVRDDGAARPKTSDAEARTVREVVAGLLARGVGEEEIGIIAPYRAQVANLRRHLFADDATTSPLTVDTVDRFQGGERKVIIISFATTSTPEAQSHLHNFLTNPNRLNVALTRAESKLILVGYAHALKTLPVFEKLLLYCKYSDTLIQHTSPTPNNNPTL